MWEGRAAASFFFTWVVDFLINIILWVVGDIKIKISCLVGKLKLTQLISFKTITAAFTPPRMLTTVKKSETCHVFVLIFFVIALSPLSLETEIDLPPLRRGAM